MSLFSFLKKYFSRNRQFVRRLSITLGFNPKNVSLYQLAFRHKSVSPYLKSGLKNSNERLEFLGDAVLGAIVAEFLFRKYPLKGEGFLTEMRSKMVNRSYLNQLAHKMDLNTYLHYDTKIINNSLKREALLGDLFEALLGAIYLDKGYLFTRKYILKQIISRHIDVDLLERTETNFKSRLIEWCQHNGKSIHFEVIEDDRKNIGNLRLFTVKAVIDGEDKGIGQDHTKKNAEKNAAENAYEQLFTP